MFSVFFFLSSHNSKGNHKRKHILFKGALDLSNKVIRSRHPKLISFTLTNLDIDSTNQTVNCFERINNIAIISIMFQERKITNLNSYYVDMFIDVEIFKGNILSCGAHALMQLLSQERKILCMFYSINKIKIFWNSRAILSKYLSIKFFFERSFCLSCHRFIHNRDYLIISKNSESINFYYYYEHSFLLSKTRKYLNTSHYKFNYIWKIEDYNTVKNLHKTNFWL